MCVHVYFSSVQCSRQSYLMLEFVTDKLALCSENYIFFVIMHYGQKNGGLHRLVYIIIVIMHCHNITKHTCMYVLVLT